jgi:hypothetical protein
MAEDLPLPTPNQHEVGYAHSLPIPSHDDIEGMYYPECDILYLCSSNFDYEKGEFSTLTKLDREKIEDIADGDARSVDDLDLITIIENFHDKPDNMEVADHELGHAILTKQSHMRSPVVAQNASGINQFITVLKSPKWTNEVLEFAGVNQLATERKQALDKNLTRPVHEAYACIVQAYRADSLTHERLLSQLENIDQSLLDWSLSHPGYDDMAHSTPDQRNSWRQFLWSYKRSILSGATDLFVTLDDQLAYRLLTTAASSAIHMYLTDSDDVTEHTSRGIPTIAFANAVVSLHKDRNELFTLKESGVDDEVLIETFRESVGFGSVGLESVEKGLRQNAYDQVNGEAAVGLLNTIQQDLRSTKLPSLMLIEDGHTNTIYPVYNPAGIQPWIIFLTLLRQTFIESIYHNSWKLENSLYAPLLDDLDSGIELENDFEGTRPILHTQELFAEVSDRLGCSDVQSKAANLHVQQLQQTGFDELGGELAVSDEKSILQLTKSRHITGHLKLLSQLPAGKERMSIENGSMLVQELVHSWSETSVEGYLGSVIVSIAGYTGVEPSTPRLTRFRGLVQQIAMEHDDPEQFIGTVYGQAIGQVFPSVDSTNPAAWIARLSNDVRKILQTSTFGEACYTSYGENVLLKYIQERETQQPNKTVTPSEFSDETTTLVTTLIETALVTEIEIVHFQHILTTDAGKIARVDEETGLQWVKEIMRGIVVVADQNERLQTAVPFIASAIFSVITEQKPAKCASILKTAEEYSERYPEIVDIDEFYRFLEDAIDRLENDQIETDWLPFLRARHAAICE